MNKLGVEAMPPVPFSQVIAAMSSGVFNPVVYRPLFEQLGKVTCRTFETPAAGTIPLFVLEPRLCARDLRRRGRRELVLAGDRPQDKIADVLRRPGHYAEIVRGDTRGVPPAAQPQARLRQLIEIVEG